MNCPKCGSEMIDDDAFPDPGDRWKARTVSYCPNCDYGFDHPFRRKRGHLEKMKP